MPEPNPMASAARHPPDAMTLLVTGSATNWV